MDAYEQEMIDFLIRTGHGDDIERDYILNVCIYDSLNNTQKNIKIKVKGKRSIYYVYRALLARGYIDTSYCFKGWPIVGGRPYRDKFVCELGDGATVFLTNQEDEFSSKMPNELMYGCPNADSAPGIVPECMLTEFGGIDSNQI